MGSVFFLNMCRCENLSWTLGALKMQFNCSLIGTTPRGGETSMKKFLDQHKDVSTHILLFGSEAHGLSTEILQNCDLTYTIPMNAGIDSINVANALAITLYEATRQE